jgi:HK97 family phage prohead protease
MNNKNMKTKIFPSFTQSMDAETGIVEAYVSVMGIRDLWEPPDVIQLGAFTKSIQERGPQGARKIRVLHQHNWESVIGVPLMLVEHPRDMLPPALLEKYPDATGGLFTRTQFVMDVQLGRETYALYKAGAMDEWSIGYDLLQYEYLKENDDPYYLLKEIRLWEYSPVTWGANPATTTTAVKNSQTTALAEPHADALTREMVAKKLKLLEIDLAMQQTRSRRLK